ncbi:MAG: response regulator [Pseudomonadota bacterium]
MGTESTTGGAATAEIIFVDDMPQLLQIADAMFAQMGYAGRCFQGPADALNYVADQSAAEGCDSIAMLITDQSMPGMSGVALIQAAQQICSNLPGVLSTSVPDDRMLQEYKAAGVTAVLAKPFSMAELRALLEEHAGPRCG